MSPLFRRAPRAALAILGFHNITPVPSQPFLSPDFPRRFRRLLRLAKKRYEVVTVAEGQRRLASDERLERPLLAFIFDDGYADMHGTIMPLMRAEGLVGTSYVVLDSLERGSLPWYEELGRLVYGMKGGRLEFALGDEALTYEIPENRHDRVEVFWTITRKLKQDFHPGVPGLVAELKRHHGVGDHAAENRALMMTVAQARELLAAGFELGSHSISHPILPSLDEDGLRHEIGDSRQRLEELLDHEVRSFCYPNGDNDQRCQEAVARAGYDCAVSMACGANLRGAHDRFRLKRAAMSEDIRALWPWHTLYRVHASLVEEAAAG
ncbi:MAG: polysaccharide deacetylase family protein [Planctomycetes bacterium]|nr:polysaccharide deacetylase family protein [Planctomycetota bacterium]